MRYSLRATAQRKSFPLLTRFRGWTTSATLRESLINYVARELNETYKQASGELPSEDAVNLAIKTGFNNLDNEIVHKSVEKVFKGVIAACSVRIMRSIVVL
jgi:pyruvate dehydrogenase phosphatase